MPEISSVLAIGGHAADMEFTAGALVAKYALAGARAVFLHLTAGEMGHPRLSGQEYARQKYEEAHNAAQVLGAEARFLPYADASLPCNDEVAYQIADVIREVRPQVVLTHWRGSFHSDHVNTHHNTMRALFLAALPAIARSHPPHSPDTVLFPENWEDMEDFDPNLYVDIDDVYDQWLEAANQYELFRGGISSFRYRDYYQALAIMRGCLSGYARAVALMRPKGALISRVRGLPEAGTPGFVI
ncbi:MAG TPA: PIG-L family deacetylase [Chloroflexota bacterium]|nr:PIG-L family deacetylase [Chloroflexota bacterium]